MIPALIGGFAAVLVICLVIGLAYVYALAIVDANLPPENRD